MLTEEGAANFGQLQNWRSEADGELVFYIFDLLWYEGKSLLNFSLIERQAVLKQVLPISDESIRLSQVFNSSGIEFFNAAEQLGLEGIIAKKASSLYTPDFRSKEWLKIKANKRQEVIIAGYTKNEDFGKHFSSLLLGIYEGRKLQYVGKVGTGFLKQIREK